MDRIELEQKLDRDSRRFLAAVQYYGGEANTSEVRSRTGLSASKTHTRYDVLFDAGLIDITRADVGHGDREPPKIAHLTGKARREIEKGILRDIDADRTPDETHDLEAEVHSLTQENAELREMVNGLTEALRQVSDRVDGLDEDMEEVHEWGETVEDSIQTLWDDRE
jgi:DNA-binding Lrp family transcriptional regulator